MSAWSEHDDTASAVRAALGSGRAAVAEKEKAQVACEQVGSKDGIVSIEDLAQEFRQVRKAFADVEASEKAGNDEELQKDISKTLAALDVCEKAVRLLGVFSPGEMVEEHSAETLVYLLVNYYSGKLSLKRCFVNDTSGQERLSAVQQARAFLESFLEKAVEMYAADESDRVYWAKHQQASQEDWVAKGQGRSMGASAFMAVAGREAKMERFRQARAAKLQLEEMMQKVAQARLASEADEDTERDVAILEVSCAVKNAIDEYESATQELEILQHMAKMKIHHGPPPKAPEPRPFQVTHVSKDLSVTRETIKADIFRPSWRQPTMTLEELADIEMQQAREKEAREAAYRKENPEIYDAKQLEERGLEDDLDKADLAAKKDRDWDDWKDDNPKGHGVTKRF